MLKFTCLRQNLKWGVGAFTVGDTFTAGDTFTVGDTFILKLQ